MSSVVPPQTSHSLNGVKSHGFSHKVASCAASSLTLVELSTLWSSFPSSQFPRLAPKQTSFSFDREHWWSKCGKSTTIPARPRSIFRELWLVCLHGQNCGRTHPPLRVFLDRSVMTDEGPNNHQGRKVPNLFVVKTSHPVDSLCHIMQHHLGLSSWTRG